MVFAVILSRQAVQGRSDGKHGEHHRDGWRGQGEVPRPPPAAEPGVRPGRQDDLPSLATNLTDEAAKLVADPKSTLDHMKERQSITLAVDTINDSRSLKYGKWEMECEVQYRGLAAGG